MRPRNVGVFSVIIGIIFLFMPLYWDTIQAIGVSQVLDPAAAIGAAPGGGYPAAVGAAALGIGGVVVWLAGMDNPPTTVVLAGGIGGAVIGILATTLLASARVSLAIHIGLAGAAPGFAAVRGAATEQTNRRIGTGLVVLSLAPFVGAHIFRGATVGGLAGVASVLLAGTLIVYTVGLSYPLHRLGRAIQ